MGVVCRTNTGILEMFQIRQYPVQPGQTLIPYHALGIIFDQTPGVISACDRLLLASGRPRQDLLVS